MKSKCYSPWCKLSHTLSMIVAICFLSLKTFAGDLKIGAAAVKITPPVGIPMAGYYYERGADKIHDDLYAKALVIEKDNLKVAIVTCDLTAITSKDANSKIINSKTALLLINLELFLFE